MAANSSRKTKAQKNEYYKEKNIKNALDKRVERLDLLKSIAQAPAGLIIGQLMYGDAKGLGLTFVISYRVKLRTQPWSLVQSLFSSAIKSLACRCIRKIHVHC